MPASASVTLVLTSCIEVTTPEFVQRNQTSVRLADYKKSLQWWLTKQSSLKNIIFCDNSGYPLDELQQIAQRYQGDKQVEFLSYHFTTYRDQGYGWGEIDIYRHIVTHSKLFADSQYVAFCAGRKYIKNIKKICAELPTDFDIIHNWAHNLAWAESDLFFIQRPVFTDHYLPLLENYHNQRDPYFIHERALASATHELIQQDFSWYPIAYYPQYRGVMGRKNLSLWWRKENYSLYNWLISRVSRWHYQQNRIIWGRKGAHLLDRLKIRNAYSKVK